MVSSTFLTDSVDLVKQDGSRVDNLRASVQGDRIYMNADGLHIEPGDLIVRHLSVGADETYLVVDPEFHERFGSFEPSYQMHVRRADALEVGRASVVFNVTGHNARVNQNSVDNSVNVVDVNPELLDLVRGLREAISSAQIDDEARSAALEIADAVELQFGTGKPSRSVVEALLRALPVVASVTAIASSIVSMLR